MIPPELVSFWEYVTQSTAAHRYVGFFVALYCVVRAFIVEPSDISVGYAGGFHFIFTGMYVVIAGSYDVPTTIEIICVQTIMLVGLIFESVIFWHYVFFPLLLCLFLLLEIRIPGSNTASLWYAM